MDEVDLAVQADYIGLIMYSKNGAVVRGYCYRSLSNYARNKNASETRQSLRVSSMQTTWTYHFRQFPMWVLLSTFLIAIDLLGISGGVGRS
jgi:hypothetical protein